MFKYLPVKSPFFTSKAFKGTGTVFTNANFLLP